MLETAEIRGVEPGGMLDPDLPGQVRTAEGDVLKCIRTDSGEKLE